MSIIGLEIRLNLLLRENCFKKKICEQNEKIGAVQECLCRSTRKIVKNILAFFVKYRYYISKVSI
jgi:hypothetical protein